MPLVKRLRIQSALKLQQTHIQYTNRITVEALTKKREHYEELGKTPPKQIAIQSKMIGVVHTFSFRET